jgi:hypothetical protein
MFLLFRLRSLFHLLAKSILHVRRHSPFKRLQLYIGRSSQHQQHFLWKLSLHGEFQEIHSSLSMLNVKLNLVI